MSKLSLEILENTALNYHKLMVPALFESRSQDVVSEAKIKHGDKVLDVACGTGVLARNAAKQTGDSKSVVGLDVNPGMLAVAKKISPKIDWREGTAEDLPWNDHSFDAVVSQFGLMFFEDKPKALQEMHRVLKPGGRLVIAVFDLLDNIPGYRIMTSIFGNTVGDDVARALKLPFSLGDTGQLKSLCKDSGFDKAKITTRHNNVRFPDVRTMVLADVKGWFPLAGINLNQQQIDEVVNRAESDLSPYILNDDTVEFPMPVHFILIEKN